MPIVMTPEEWAHLVRWTENREDPDTVRKREYVKFLNETSREMTKSWPNSVENVNKRNEEIRQARLDAAEQANSKFYKRYMKRKKEEEVRLMYSARDIVFKNKDAPKLLLSAVIETAVLKEQEEQRKFNAELRQKAADQKRKDDDDIIRHSVEWHELMAQRAKRRFEVNKQHQKDLLDQAHEYAERERKEKEDELNMQKLDNVNANKEMKALKKFEDDFKAADRRRIFADMQLAREETAQRRREHAALDKMDDRLLDVLLRSRARTERRRMQTVKNEREEKQRVLDAISSKLQTGTAARDAYEQACLDKAKAEKDAIDAARREQQARNKEDIRQQRLESRRQYLRDEARRMHERDTNRTWAMMNKFKNKEIYDDYLKKVRLEKERKIKEFKEDTNRLKKERADREAQERADQRYFYGELALAKLRDQDNKVLTHADNLIEEAKAHGRPTMPLRQVIDRYCTLYRLYPMPNLPKSLQEHTKDYAPWDGSRPDPWYVAPPAPPPDLGPDAPDEPDEPDQPDQPETKGKTDGMQDPKPGPSKPKPKQEQKSAKSDDYKRAGPANGMQSALGMDIYVTSLPMTPCTARDCSCELKLFK